MEFLLWLVIFYLLYKCFFVNRGKKNRIQPPPYVDQQAMTNYVFLCQIAHVLRKVVNDDIVNISLSSELKKEAEDLLKQFYRN